MNGTERKREAEGERGGRAEGRESMKEKEQDKLTHIPNNWIDSFAEHTSGRTVEKYFHKIPIP